METTVYKLYNHKSKLDKFSELIRISGEIQNHIIALNKRYYKLYGKSFNKARMQKHIAKLRKRNLRWQKLGAQTVQAISERVDLAFKSFFNPKTVVTRPPKLKKLRKYKSIRFKQDGYRIEGNILTINSVKVSIPFKLHRSYGKIQSVILKRNTLGEFFVIIRSHKVVEVDSQKKVKTGKRAGFDFGLKTFLTSSDNEKVASPQFFLQSLKEIKRLNRRISKCKKGSKNKQKLAKQIRRLHEKVTNQRNDYHWKLANQLCDRYDFLAFEDLNLKAMKKLWGRKISDLGFHSFLTKLEHVASKRGKDIKYIDRFFASSKTCSCCGNKKEDLNLKDRTYHCDKCSHEIDRDFNAAINILIAAS